MVILDPDHITILERSAGDEAQRLLTRLNRLGPEEIATTIISYEEQTRGWLAYLARARTLDRQVAAYQRLKRHLDNYRSIPVLEFGEGAAVEYQRLQKTRPRLGTMDLKIAAIALVHEATLLSRNLRDFRQIPGLSVEDWCS